MTTTEMTMDLTTKTPVEIDTMLADLWDKRYRAQDRAALMWSYVNNEISIVKGLRGGKISSSTVGEWLAEHSEISESEEMQREAYGIQAHTARQAWDHYLQALDAEVVADDVFSDIQPLEQEFTRRGGWTRAFLVDNTNGHVHSSMHCSTCFVTTRFRWMTDFSGKSEAEVVEAAGERACTVCYPSAPVEVLARPTQMFTKDEEAKAKARQEREAKKAQAEAAQVQVVLYSEYGSAPRAKTFKTVRAATNAIASDLGSLCWYGEGHPDAEAWKSNVANVRAALQDKGEAYDYEKALANARKKVTREGGSPKF